MGKYLVTGSLGQIGIELLNKLADLYGKENVVASDIASYNGDFTFESCDVTQKSQLESIIERHKITEVYHLASLLSASGERNPQLSWDINIGGFLNVLELARIHKLRIFVPSSIACFGPSTPAADTPQDTIQRPTTIYGVTKTTIELLSDYYVKKYDMDIRGLRFPGLISYKQEPGGGTTDYAVDIYFKAVREGKFICPLGENTYMDMMYMDDAIRAITDLMAAPKDKLEHFNAFNLGAFSASPKDFAASIKKFIPDFSISYEVNPVLQGIADSWPDRMDDSAARKEWGWKHDYDLDACTELMLSEIRKMQG